MDITTLPFDADTMLEGLRPWVEIESPTFDAARVNAMMDYAARECAASGATVERIAGRMGFGDCVRATFPFGTRISRASSSWAISTPCIPLGRSRHCRGGATASGTMAPVSST